MTLRTLKSTLRALPASTLRTANGSWRDGRTTAQRGYGGRWQRARRQFLALNVLCVFCDKAGRIELANVVDHIVPHQGDLKLFWDRKNWQALCKTCHDGEKRRLEHGKAPAVRFDADGQVIW